MHPGEYFLEDGEIAINAGRRAARVTVRQTGDRPIQVGSHYHFYEVNRALEFDREAAYGMRLDIPAGTSVRFEPGETKSVDLVELAGTRVVFGPVSSMFEAPAGALALRLTSPNPVRNRIDVEFETSCAGRVRLCAMDVQGRVRAVLVDEPMPPGVHRASWDVSAHPPSPSAGVLWLRLETDEGVRTARCVLMR